MEQHQTAELAERYSLRGRWRRWVGDRHLELAIRRRLEKESFASHTAELLDVRLVAAERPGWRQVFFFEVHTRNQDQQPVSLLGIVADDGRKFSKVRLFHDEADRAELFDQWSEGLITLRREPLHLVQKLLLGLFAGAMLVAVAAAIAVAIGD